MVVPPLSFTAAVLGTMVALHGLKRHFLLFSMVVMPSTIAHELAHLLVSLAVGGQPSRISLIPRRERNTYTLGQVAVRNTRWWNCTIIGLAPLGLLAGAYWIATSRFGILSFSLTSAAAVYVTASLVQGSIPSSQDLKVAFGSVGIWIVLALVVGILVYRHFPH